MLIFPKQISVKKHPSNCQTKLNHPVDRNIPVFRSSLVVDAPTGPPGRSRRLPGDIWEPEGYWKSKMCPNTSDFIFENSTTSFFTRAQLEPFWGNNVGSIDCGTMQSSDVIKTKSKYYRLQHVKDTKA
jgi:hypothetical protein